MGADPIACAALAGPARDGKALLRPQGAQGARAERWVEGPAARAPATRCLVVEDVVTTGGSTVKAVERVLAEGLEVRGRGVASSTGWPAAASAIEAAGGAPYSALTTIDEIYPERPDRG